MSGPRTTNFDAVAAAAPLDRQASVIRDGSGDQWEATISPSQKHFKAPPPPNGFRPARLEDFTGRIFDRLTVFRFHGVTGAGRFVWLVRCVCGDYELRRHETLLQAEGKPMSCMACQRLDDMRRRSAKPVRAKDREASAARLDTLARGRKR